MRNSFVFYKDWWEVLQELPKEQRLESYEAICNYAFGGITPDDAIIKAVTGLMRSAIDRDNKKFEDRCEKNRKNILKRWDKGDTTEYGGIRPNTTVKNVIRLDTKHTEKEKENYNDNENETKERTKVPKKDDLSLPPKSTLKQKQDTMLKRKAEFKDELSQFLDRYSADMLNDFFSYWTEPNKSHTKMLFETKQTWDTSRRLSRWEKNNCKYGKGGNV
jgi:hypothetical protein